MSYEPTEWKKGDVVTSQKLNKLEQGIAGAGGVLVLSGTPSEGKFTLNKTAGEIIEASKVGLVMFGTHSEQLGMIWYFSSYEYQGEFVLEFVLLSSNPVQRMDFYADTLDDYPASSME